MVLVLVDALRPDHLGSYGYSKATSPNIDRLAREGSRYTRVYANAPWTRPSTASFLTGLNASRHRAESAKSKLPKNVTTLAERLRKRGWVTAGFVANGNGGSLAGLEKGFHLFRDPTNYYTKSKRGKTYNGLPRGELIVEDSLKWLKRQKNKNVFLFLFLVDPHDPYRAPRRLEKEFLPKGYKGKVRRTALWEYNNDYSPQEREAMISVYDASIRYADEALGKFFDGLKTQGRYDDSTIMVSADHGEGFGEHNFYLHAHHFWDEVVRIPLVIKGPQFKAGTVNNMLCDSIDVTRTLAQLGEAVHADLPGNSLLGVHAPGKVVISEYNEFGIRRQAAVNDSYKVIWQKPVDQKRFLEAVKRPEYFPSVSMDKEVVRIFNLKSDPMEKNDLLSGAPKEALKLLDTLRAFVNRSREQGS
ncbi:MAG: sulfatase [Myxococcota bacterium]|nr:sulfatase [Myxococcota bacterium]